MRRIAAAGIAIIALLTAHEGALAQSDSEEPRSPNPNTPLPGSGRTGGPAIPDRPDAPVPPSPVEVDGDIVTVTVTDTNAGSTPGVEFDTPNDTGPACGPWETVQSFESAQDDDPLLPGLNRTNVDGTISTWSTRTCDGLPPDYRWIPTGVDPDVVINSAIDQAIARIPVPTPDVNPAPDVGSYVNLGLWLATVDPGEIPVTASIGGVSATATIQLVETTFDLGDGTTITCDGHGTPIPDEAVESADPSPTCGHVYLQSSPDETPYQLTITAASDITWTASTGATGDAGRYTTITTVDYDVDELQTLGTG